MAHYVNPSNEKPGRYFGQYVQGDTMELADGSQWEYHPEEGWFIVPSSLIGLSGAAIAVYDEALLRTAAVRGFRFTGDGVLATTVIGDEVVVTIPGVAVGTDLSYDEGTRALASNTGDGVTLPLADVDTDGFLSSSDWAVIQTIEPGAQVNVDTNLSYTASTRTLASSTGDPVVLPVADGTNAGLFTAASFTKLAGIATGATANSPDATLLNRVNHTGPQSTSTLSDFNANVRAQIEAALAAGSNVTITPSGSGATRILTLASTAVGGGGGSGGSIGEYASIGALRTAHPAASSDGLIATVNGALYMADNMSPTPDWVPLITFENGNAKAAGVLLESTYTVAQLDALLAGRGYVISRVSRPILKPSSGSSTTAGLITLNTSLNSNNTWSIPGGGIPAKIWLPGGFVTTPNIASAQLHDCTITAANQVQLTGTVTTVTSFSSDNNASFIPLHTFTLPGGLFGSNSQLDFEAGTSHSGTLTNNHIIEFFNGATSLGGASNNGVALRSRVSLARLRGRGLNATSKIGSWPSAANSTSHSAADYPFQFLEVNTAADTTWAVSVKCSNADNIILDSFTATLWLS
jgi:hypothetical protein